MTNKTNAVVFMPSRKQAMEMMPVAMTNAKYPGHRSAAARERSLDEVAGIASVMVGFRLRFLRRIVCNRAQCRCVRRVLLPSGPRCELSAADRAGRAVDVRTPESRASVARRLDRNR